MARVETDLSTEVALRAAVMLSKAQAIMEKQISLGPLKARLAPKDAYQRILALPPEKIKQIADKMGTEAFLTQLTQLRDGARNA